MRSVTLAVLLGLSAVPLGLSAVAPAAADPVPAPAAACGITDPRLAELSGMVADDTHWYVVNDGGKATIVYVLGKDCQVRETITAPTDPYDVEDLARAPDGTFWLSDTGDNDGDRDTVALITLTPAGESTFFRLTYPDGKHDAEALLLDAAGVPYIVTKSSIGTADVYRPAGPLTAPGPTPLEHVAAVRLTSTDTPGGPVPGVVGSVVVTGAAMSVDGTVIALRTYTEAYLFPVTGGDLVGAFAATPVRVPLPNEAQGEAIAFQPDGSLVTGSEAGPDGAPQPVNVVAGAALLVAPEPPVNAEKPRTATTLSAEEKLLTAPRLAVVAAAIGVVYLLFRWVRRSRRQ